MTGSLLLALDQGTSATKALALDEAGRIVARASRPLTQRFPGPGRVEQDAEQIWGSCVAALTDLMADRSWRSVAGIALSTQRESVVAWDAATGAALAPLLSWQDRRGAELCQALAGQGHAGLISDRSGLPLDPMFSAAKLNWLLRHHEPVRAAARAGRLRVGTVDAWLLWRLTGRQHLSEIGNASRTQLLDLATGRWDERLLELFGVPAAALPEVRSSTGPFGAVADVPGLAAGVPVLAVLGDSHAALFSHAGFQPGTVKATLGTGSSVMATISVDTRAPAGLARTIAWQTDGAAPTYALEGNIASAGAAVRWVTQLLGCDEDGLTRLSVQASPESAGTRDGVALVPAFNGLGAPYWDRTARAVLVGISQSTGPAELARAALESVAFQVADTVALVDKALGGVHELRVDGGISANDAMLRLLADLTERPVHRTAAPEGSALGAAYLAGLAAGRWNEADIAALGHVTTTFRPSTDDDWRAASLSRWYDALARARLRPGGA